MVESNEFLTAAEWYSFLINEVRLPPVANNEIENLAQELERHYMTKEGFSNLSTDDLKTEFNFDRLGLLNRFIEWKTSLAGVTTPVATTTDSTSNNNNQTSSGLTENPLMSFIDLISTAARLNNEQMARVMSDSSTRNVSQMASNLGSNIDIIQSFSNSTVSQDDRIYYRCKACGKTVWVARAMSAFVDFPGCFNCQQHWLTSVFGVSEQN